MNFAMTDELTELQSRTRQFIAEHVIPLEHDHRQTPHGPAEELKHELVGKAGEAGLLTPHASKKLGGSA